MINTKKPILPRPKLNNRQKQFKRSHYNKLTASINLAMNQDTSKESTLNLRRLLYSKNANSSLNLTANKRSNKENLRPNLNYCKKYESKVDISKKRRMYNNKSQLSLKNNLTNTQIVSKESQRLSIDKLTIKNLYHEMNVKAKESIRLIPKLNTENQMLIQIELLTKPIAFVNSIEPDLEIFQSLM